jgi:RNA-binding protein YlmH
MINRELILGRISKNDDRLLVSRVIDKVQLAMKIQKPVHTDFLDPNQQSIIQRAFLELDDIEYDFNGGFNGAERAVVVFRPVFIDDEDLTNDFFKLLYIKLSSRDILSHRDYLGSLMGLGIKREKTGDIIVGEDECNIVVISEIAEYIALNLTKVGNNSVTVQIREIGELSVPEPKTREISVTVASLRLDCIAAPGFGMSRSKAAEYIKAGKLNLNWVTVENSDRTVREGDTISIKGKGRVVIEKVWGKTKKDRIGIILKKYV